MNGPQLHLLINHFPIVGFFLITPLVIFSILKNDLYLKKISLIGVFLISLFAIPAYFTGEPAEEGLEEVIELSESQVHQHEEAGEKGIILSLITGFLSLAVFFQSKKTNTISNKSMFLVALLCLFTSFCMAWIGHEGGKIRHSEIGN